jgi:uncharacterized protein YajQ (UPF0234 family)
MDTVRGERLDREGGGERGVDPARDAEERSLEVALPGVVARAADERLEDLLDLARRRLARRPLDGPGPRVDLDDEQTIALRAELDARAAQDGIDEETAKELLLRLRERHVQRELQSAEFERVPELQTTLARIRQALSGLA